MEVRCLVPEDRGAYLAHFNKKEYPAWFSRYQALAQPVFDRLDTPEKAEAAAAAHGGQGAAAFAGRLAEHWQRSYPRQPFLQGTYEELMQGFAEKRFLGLNAKWLGLKE